MPTRRPLLGLVRFAALAAIAVFLAGQIEGDDVLERTDGTRLVGRVRGAEGGGWVVEPADGGPPVRVAPGDVATRGGPERAVPAVSWGLSTLGGRLARHVDVAALVLLLLTGLIVLTAWRWQLLLRAAEVRVPFPRCVRLTFIGSFFNLVVPGATGGDVVKAWYAARSTGQGTRSVVAVFVDRAIGLVGLAVFAGLVLLVAPAKDGYGPARMVVLAVLGGTAFLLAILLARPLRRVLGLGRLARVLPFQRLQAEVRAALHLYRRHAAALGVALAVSLVNHGAAAFGVYLLGRALGIQGLEVGTTLALVPVANLFAAIPLVPGGWGVGELAFAWLFGQVGIAPTEAVGLSVVSRFAAVASSLPGGVMWIVWKERPTQAAIAETVEAAEEQVEAAEADPAPAPP